MISKVFGLLFLGWGIGIRTPTGRVRVCSATVTQFPKIFRLQKYIIHVFLLLSTRKYKN